MTKEAAIEELNGMKQRNLEEIPASFGYGMLFPDFEEIYDGEMRGIANDYSPKEDFEMRVADKYYYDTAVDILIEALEASEDDNPLAIAGDLIFKYEDPFVFGSVSFRNPEGPIAQFHEQICNYLTFIVDELTETDAYYDEQAKLREEEGVFRDEHYT